MGTTHGPNWASSSLSNATARYAAQQVINTSVDGHISPNDKITLIHGETAATRIYQGNRTNDASSSGPVAASSFSAKVTEFIDGSAIVSGTLSADTLAANTTISNSLNVADNLKLGKTAVMQLVEFTVLIKQALVILMQVFTWTGLAMFISEIILIILNLLQALPAR